MEVGRSEELLVGVEGDTESALHTVTVEDKTSAVVVWGVHAAHNRPTWDHKPVVAGKCSTQILLCADHFILYHIVQGALNI